MDVRYKSSFSRKVSQVMYEYEVELQFYNRPEPHVDFNMLVTVYVVSKVVPLSIRNDVYADFADPEFTTEGKNAIVEQATAQYAERTGHKLSGWDNVVIKIVTFGIDDYEGTTTE